MLRKAIADPVRTRHVRYHPSPDLTEYVEHYWSVAWNFRGVAPERVEILPHPSVHLVFDGQAGGKIRGVTRGKFARLLSDKGRVFAVKFTPGGFYPFLGLPVATITDKLTNVHDVFGDEGVTLARAILAKRTDAARVALVETFLRQRRPEPDDDVARISGMVYGIAEDRTIVKVDDLVARYRINKRTLERLFAKYVGVSPKWVIQRYRLHEAAEQLASGSGVKQSDLALRLGYSDQAHFIRDFKAIVGTSPVAYARSLRTSKP